MCMAIMPVLSLALGAAQAVMGYQAQSAAADRQNQMYAANAEAANAAARATYANQQNAIIQKRNAATQDKTENAIKALDARGTVNNSAGEAGVTGLSVDALIDDYYAKEGRHSDSVDQQYQMDRDYLRSEMDSTYAQTQSRINSVQRAAPPSFASALLGIGSAALGAGKMAYGMQTASRGADFSPSYSY